MNFCSGILFTIFNNTVSISMFSRKIPGSTRINCDLSPTESTYYLGKALTMAQQSAHSICPIQFYMPISANEKQIIMSAWLASEVNCITYIVTSHSMALTLIWFPQNLEGGKRHNRRLILFNKLLVRKFGAALGDHMFKIVGICVERLRKLLQEKKINVMKYNMNTTNNHESEITIGRFQDERGKRKVCRAWGARMINNGTVKSIISATPYQDNVLLDSRVSGKRIRLTI
jgi:hypothetical protein